MPISCWPARHRVYPASSKWGGGERPGIAPLAPRLGTCELGSARIWIAPAAASLAREKARYPKTSSTASPSERLFRKASTLTTTSQSVTSGNVRSDDNVLPAITGGALSYLLKDSEPDDLVRAIHQV